MADKKLIKTYHFTVEGETEQWYLFWLMEQINKHENIKCKVSIKPIVQQSPRKFAKGITPKSVPFAIHLCDYESNEPCHQKKFLDILDQLKDSNGYYGKRFKYSLGYSNFTFELWMVLHKMDCNTSLANRTQYLSFINRAFDEHFEDLHHYKSEDCFKKCLSKLTISDVVCAIKRAKMIMKNNKDNGWHEVEYKGNKFYKDNPSLTIYQSVERILMDCGIIPKAKNKK